MEYQLQMLTYEGVRQAGRKAYEEGRLGFQHGYGTCRYVYNDSVLDDDKRCGCVVGVALTKETAAKIVNGTINEVNVFLLVERGYVDVPDGHEMCKIRALQQAHDDICTSGPGRKDQRIREFVEMLYR